MLFTRRGRGGVQQVKASGLIAAVFTHRDARSGDPHLHTHVAVSNKVQDADGRWLAVDGRVLYKANVTLSETYNTLLEAELVARLGVRFSCPPDRSRPGQRKRPVREIEGIDPRLAAAWSRRNRAIEARRRELAAAFQADHGRPPTAGEAVGLGKQAWSETRQAKHAPRAEADQRAAWRARRSRSWAPRTQWTPWSRPRSDTAPRSGRSPRSGSKETAASVVEAVQADRATWQVWHLRAEAATPGPRVRRSGSPSSRTPPTGSSRPRSTHHCIAFEDPDPLTDALASGAWRDTGAGGPDPTRRGQRVQPARRPALHLPSHPRCRATHHRAPPNAAAGAPSARSGSASRSPRPPPTAPSSTPPSGRLVRELATSGRRVQLALAPAGTGKTTALQVLARAWHDAGGTILGLAPSAVAAEQLGSCINRDTTSRVGRTGRYEARRSPSWSGTSTTVRARLDATHRRADPGPGR